MRIAFIISRRRRRRQRRRRRRLSVYTHYYHIIQCVSVSCVCVCSMLLCFRVLCCVCVIGMLSCRQRRRSSQATEVTRRRFCDDDDGVGFGLHTNVLAVWRCCSSSVCVCVHFSTPHGRGEEPGCQHGGGLTRINDVMSSCFSVCVCVNVNASSAFFVSVLQILCTVLYCS